MPCPAGQHACQPGNLADPLPLPDAPPRLGGGRVAHAGLSFGSVAEDVSQLLDAEGVAMAAFMGTSGDEGGGRGGGWGGGGGGGCASPWPKRHRYETAACPGAAGWGGGQGVVLGGALLDVVSGHGLCV